MGDLQTVVAITGSLIVGLMIFLSDTKSAGFKKRWFIPFIVCVGLGTLAFLYWVFLSRYVIAIGAPLLLALWTWLIRSIRFCLICNSVTYSGTPFVRPKQCSRCQCSLD